MDRPVRPAPTTTRSVSSVKGLPDLSGKAPAVSIQYGIVFIAGLLRESVRSGARSGTTRGPGGGAVSGSAVRAGARLR
ncbi:hypothetical protein GCM10010270_29360 [Streptomyces violaceus]|nr:hypothetical protein GCM10010270_29360 [Streptomyces janthinus]